MTRQDRAHTHTQVTYAPVSFLYAQGTSAALFFFDSNTQTRLSPTSNNRRLHICYCCVHISWVLQTFHSINRELYWIVEIFAHSAQYRLRRMASSMCKPTWMSYFMWVNMGSFVLTRDFYVLSDMEQKRRLSFQWKFATNSVRANMFTVVSLNKHHTASRSAKVKTQYFRKRPSWRDIPVNNDCI